LRYGDERPETAVGDPPGADAGSVTGAGHLPSPMIEEATDPSGSIARDDLDWIAKTVDRLGRIGADPQDDEDLR